MSNGNLLDLIQCYQQAALAAVEELRSQVGTVDLLRAVNSRAAPRQGILPSGKTYEFHGVGCRFERDQQTVDVDFGPGGRCDGFDAWRLWMFAQKFVEWKAFHDLNLIRRGLEDLIAKGHVCAPRLAPSEHLFYLAASQT
jgi:hypothetical protein